MRKSFVVLVAFAIAQSLSFGQNPFSGRLNGVVYGGYNIGISPTMRGDWGEFSREVTRDLNNSKFPFGDASTVGLSGGVQFGYLPDASSIGPYLGYTFTYFQSGVDSAGFFTLKSVRVLSSTVSLGAEYIVNSSADRWNLIIRAGINTSTLSGIVHLGESDVPSAFRGSDINVPAAQRYGIEAGLGGVWNIAPSALGLEAAAHYSYLNMFGKSFTRPERAGFIPDERELNDGKNPDRHEDTERIFDFLSLRLGLRMWF